MNSLESEIEASILSSNYLEGLKVAKQWLFDTTESDESDIKYQKAKEAYTYTKFFADRYKRIYSVKIGKERANIFTSYLKILKDIRKKNEFCLENQLWKCVHKIIHSEIAKNLAKDMAGQKFYNLQENDIFQLAFSLIELQDFKVAESTLIFLYNMKSKSPLVNLLLAFVSYENQDIHQMESYLREALFINPDILKDHSKFIPGNRLKQLWKEVGELGFDDEIRCRNFALLIEVNDVYTKKREISHIELQKIETDYEKLSKEYTQNLRSRYLIQPRLLHYLTWMVFYFMKYSNYEKAEHYQKIMIEWEPEIYNMLKENHLKQLL